MIKTLVINPPFLEPHRPPISCALIGEVARLAGHDVTMLDINIELFHAIGHTKFMQYQNDYLFASNSPSESSLRDFVLNSVNAEFIKSFDWILVSCFSDWEYAMTEMIVVHCKKYSTAKIVIGGPGVHTQGKTLLEQGHVDYWVVGEGELALKSLFEGEDDYPGINGREPKQIDDIENLPLPNYEFFDLSRYDWILDTPDVFIYGSRGCVRSCTFCDVASYWPKFRWRSGNSIADEMIMNYEKFGIKNFYFSDSLLNGNVKEFKIFLNRLSKFDDAKKFRWGGYAIIRPKNQHPAELFDQMKAAGGRFLSVGVESGVDRIRLDMKKHFTNDDVEWHLEQSQRIQLQNIFLMMGSWYNETLQEHHEYLEIFKRWQPYAADGTIFGMIMSPPLTLLPNTPLRKLLEDDSMIMGFEFQKISQKNQYWTNTAMPDLTFIERYRRTVALVNEATKYNWNIHNKDVKLNEIKLALESYLSVKSESAKITHPIFPLHH